MMRTEQALDYAVFQLSPNRSRCELLVASNGSTERLASGLVKPFVAHLKIAEEQFSLSAQTIRLEVKEHKPEELWFTKGTLERFVRFVSTPEILELANRLDSELSQLEAARKIYSQQDATDKQHSGVSGGHGSGMVESADDTKKELVRAIDVRAAAVKQDLTAACARAAAAGFRKESVLELQAFADRFGSHRLSDVCREAVSLFERRPELTNARSSRGEDRALRSSFSSDMSIDDSPRNQVHQSRQQMQPEGLPGGGGTSVIRQVKSSSLSHGEMPLEQRTEEDDAVSAEPLSRSKRFSVQDRINMFESKQKESSESTGVLKAVSGKSSAVLRRLSSDSSTPPLLEKAVLRRWSAVSDMSIDTESPQSAPNSHPEPSPTAAIAPDDTLTPQSKPPTREAGDSDPPRKNSVNQSDPDASRPSKDDVSGAGSVPWTMKPARKNGSAPEERERTVQPPPQRTKQQARDAQELRMKADELERHFEDSFKVTPGRTAADDRARHDDDRTSGGAAKGDGADESRGKLYGRYTQKRDAKLRSEWSSRRSEKEAKMKAMQDSFERSREDMKVKLISGEGTRDSARRRAEKFRSFNARSSARQPAAEEEFDASAEKQPAEDGAKRTTAAPALGRSPSSTTPASSGLLARSAVRRRPHSENPLAQSVPNFAEMRKANKAARPPSRGKEEKPRTSQAVKKTAAVNTVLPSCSDNAVPAPAERETVAAEREDSAGRESGASVEEPGNGRASHEGKCDLATLLAENNENGASGDWDFDAAVVATAMPDSAGESPVSWRSHGAARHVQSEAESPADSPSSWSFAEDGARVRKQWDAGVTPKPASAALLQQQRKDVKKGFKRLLKFGRKTRGPEGTSDWISVTTSEGDDDADDVRDPPNRSLEDLRKSRMAPADDGFNEAEFFNDTHGLPESSSLSSSIPAPPAHFKLRDDHMSSSSLKAPRSFFSLSSFRSKTSESKAR